jgi:hypothetical protein
MLCYLGMRALEELGLWLFKGPVAFIDLSRIVSYVYCIWDGQLG